MAEIEKQYEELTSAERETEALRQRIVAQEERISGHIGELSEKIKKSLNWRKYVETYPYITLGAAAGLGLLVSRMIVPEPPSTLEKVSNIVSEATGTRVGELIRSRRQKTIFSSLTGLAMTMGAALAKKAITQALLGGGKSSAPRHPSTHYTSTPQTETASWQARMER